MAGTRHRPDTHRDGDGSFGSARAGRRAHRDVSQRPCRRSYRRNAFLRRRGLVSCPTFASWRLQPLTKEYFLWFTFLSLGVFGFFISIDLFTMFMFYEVALIPMYLLIGVWGSGRKEYSAMKLTLMLMGGSAFLLIGILGIYYGSGASTTYLLNNSASGSHSPSWASACWAPCSPSIRGAPTVMLRRRRRCPCSTRAC